MPELPDIEAYCTALRPKLIGRPITRIRVHSAFILRSVDPPIDSLVGKAADDVSRLGKRIVIRHTSELHLVIHLMVAGRLRWFESNRKPPARGVEAEFHYEGGVLSITEAGTKKRASIHVVAGRDGLRAHDPGGLDPLAATVEEFAARLRERRHTLKRALTDPRILSGIGNAFSDEILHAAGLSPVTRTDRLDDTKYARLHEAARSVLKEWTRRLEERFTRRFPVPGEVTAFRPEFAVHGKYGQRCPTCGETVHRIRYADNETNYCPGCQTAGRILADRSLSRLLKDDRPRTIPEWEGL